MRKLTVTEAQIDALSEETQSHPQNGNSGSGKKYEHDDIYINDYTTHEQESQAQNEQDGRDWKDNATAPDAVLCAADVKTRAVDWLWQDVLVRGGLNSIQGVPGIGKTFLLCAITAAVSKGGFVQSVNGGMEKLECGNVLYLTGDDDPETTIVPRLKSLGANLDNIYFEKNGATPPIGGEAFNRLLERVKPSLCIVDTLQHFLPPKTSMNAANETTNVLHPLKMLAERYNCSIVLIQHINKMSASGNGGLSVNFAIGSAAVNGIFRSVWTLGLPRDEEGKTGYVRGLCSSKTNLTMGKPDSILFSLTPERGFEWLGTDPELTAEDLYNPMKKGRGRPSEGKTVDAEAFILEMIEDGEPVESEALAAAACEERITRTTLKRARTALKKTGKIEVEKVGKTWYVKTPKEGAHKYQGAHNSFEPVSATANPAELVNTGIHSIIEEPY